MSFPTPYVREAGSGPAIVCLHANASTSGQWRPLMERLSESHRVLAPDLYGAGNSPDWPSPDLITLRDEARFIGPMLDSAGRPLTLVGHSYGGAVALIAALAYPERVGAMVLYEPTLFSVVDQQSPAPNAADGIRHLVGRAGPLLDAGDLHGAAREFINFWAGDGAWAAMPEKRHAALAESVRNLRRWGHALFNEPTRLETFARLEMPILYLVGEQTREPARGVATILSQVLPNVTVMELQGIGHMGPVTHPDAVNHVIIEFLEKVEEQREERAA
jgi:pimeloyl-ACP methyl ester carboxylesterase